MANLVLTYTLANGTTADATEVQTNFNDGVTYTNARNSGAADWDIVSSAGLITGKAGIRLNAGTVGAPSYSFTGDTDTGLYNTANTIRFACGGYLQGYTIADTSAAGWWYFPNGTESAPSISFMSDIDTGMYRIGDNNLGFAVLGTNIVDISGARVSIKNPIHAVNGLISAPAYTFASKSTMGFWNNSGQLAVTVNGIANVCQFNVGYLQIANNNVIWLPATGTISAPDLTFAGDTDMGLYRSGTDALGLVATTYQFLKAVSGGNVTLNVGNTSATASSHGRITAYHNNGTYDANMRMDSFVDGSNNRNSNLDVTGVPVVETDAPGGISQMTVKINTFNTTTRTALDIDRFGHVNKPNQPSFLATSSTDATNVTGDNTLYTLPYNIEIYDQEGDFSTPNFTAPVTGRYQLNFSVYVGGLTGGETSGHIRLITSNRNYLTYLHYGVGNTATGFGRISVIADMDASDTAYCVVIVAGIAKVVDIIGGVTYNYFSGSLIN